MKLTHDVERIWKASNNIASGIVWKDTEQGKEYWQEVNSNLRKLAQQQQEHDDENS